MKKTKRNKNKMFKSLQNDLNESFYNSVIETQQVLGALQDAYSETWDSYLWDYYNSPTDGMLTVPSFVEFAREVMVEC